MAALTELMTYFDNKKMNDLRMQQMEVAIEAKRRADNAAAVERGKAMSLRDNIVNNMADIENSQIELDRINKQYSDAVSKGPLPAEWDKQYRDAKAVAEANLIMNQSIARRLYVEKGMMDGSLDKTVATSAKPMYDRIFDPKKDPYDQIQEERRTKTTDVTTGAETEVIQKGPSASFQKNEQGNDLLSNAYTSSLSTPSAQLFGDSYDEGTPEIAYRPVKTQGGVTSEEDTAGATSVDVTATQPNPNPVASQTTNPSAPAPKIGDFIRVRNKATGETGTLPSANARAAIASGRFEQVP